MEKEQCKTSLKRDLGLFPAIALVVGMVIGSGIFMKPGRVLAAAGDSTSGLAAWVLGGGIALAAGLTMAELGARIPKTGGVYVYLTEVYGRLWGYLFGWVQTVIYGPATIGALGLYFGSLLLPFLSLPEFWRLPVAVGIVVFMAALNCLGAKYGGIIQSVATVGKLIPIAIIAFFGLWKGNGQILGMSSDVSGTVSMGAAILATLWAYDGWVGVSFVAGEMKNPSKQLPQAIIFGLGIVIIAYMLINLAVLHVLPAAEIVRLDKQATGAAAGVLFGDMGGRLINTGILVSIFGALNGYILTNSRVPYAMALRGQLPWSKYFARVHPGFGTPVNAMFLEVGLAVLLMIWWDPDKLTDMAMFAVWIFYVSAFIAVFLLRRRQPGTFPSYRVPGYPAVPLIALAGAVYIIISTVFDQPVESLYALGTTLLGLPVYLMITGQKRPCPANLHFRQGSDG